MLMNKNNCGLSSGRYSNEIYFKKWNVRYILSYFSWLSLIRTSNDCNVSGRKLNYMTTIDGADAPVIYATTYIIGWVSERARTYIENRWFVVEVKSAESFELINRPQGKIKIGLLNALCAVSVTCLNALTVKVSRTHVSN